MINLEGLNKKDLQEVLKNLKLYKALHRDLKKRGRGAFEKINNSKQTFTVEYFPEMNFSDVEEISLRVFKDVLKVEVNSKDIIYVGKKDVLGGMRVVCDDMMVDLSYKKIVGYLKK